MMIKKTFALILTFFLSQLLHAQEDSLQIEITKDSFQNYRLHNLWEMGVSANAYSGDLSSYDMWSSAFQMGLKFAKKKRWNAHFGLAIGNIRGENYTYEFENESPNLTFRTNIFSLQFDLQYNFIRKKHWIAYISQGLGFMRFMPKNEYGEKLQDILSSRENNETYSNLSLIFPSSIGLIYLLKNGYGIGINASILRSNTDYLDNISLWGKNSANDNILAYKFFVTIPSWKIRKFLLGDNIPKSTTR
ncbi:MAG: hypothetical protein SFU27_05300 [Thermonemataceae bacterium]|nr:hypothetical protein [Thermonemataceae bacterium]